MNKGSVDLIIDIEKSNNLERLIENLNKINNSSFFDDNTIGIGKVNLSLNAVVQNPVTAQASNFLTEINNVIVITEIRVPKKYRGKKVANTILKLLSLYAGFDTIVFAKIQPSELEYSPKKYTLSGEPGKINLPIDEILENTNKFFEKNLYIDMNDIIPHTNYTSIYMLTNPIGIIFCQYVLDKYNTLGHPINNVVDSFYLSMIRLFNLLIDKDKSLYLYTDLKFESTYLQNISTAQLSEEWFKEINCEQDVWYSGYNGDESIKESDIYKEMRKIQELLLDLGGYEVYIRNDRELISYMDTSMILLDQSRFIDITDTIITDDMSKDLGNKLYLEMVGYALFEDGVWLYGTWNYTSTCKILYSDQSFNHQFTCKPVMFAGKITGIVL